jgi:hypothetical protein
MAGGWLDDGGGEMQKGRDIPEPGRHVNGFFFFSSFSA